METTANPQLAIVTRILIQQSLKAFYLGNTSASNWANAIQDTQSALVSGGSATQLLQIKVFPSMFLNFIGARFLYRQCGIL